MTDNNKRIRRNFIHLIASDTNHEFQYGGFCKIEINHLQSLLFVEPYKEEFTLISAMFKWKFWAQKNILFVFADSDFQDFILVFNNEFRCKKVYDLIFRKRPKHEITNDMIYKRFLSPIFNQTLRISNIAISKRLMKWLNKLDFQDKRLFIKMMKSDDIYRLIYSNVKSDKGDNGAKNGEDKVMRKRKFSQITSTNSLEKDLVIDDITCVKTQKLSSINFVKSDCEFKLVNTEGHGKCVKRLIIFNSDDKRFCYEYCRNPYMPFIFKCTECKKMGKNVYAKIEGNDFLLLQKNDHVCKMLQYSAEKYFDLKIVRKPNYEILENTNTKSGKMLIIFNPNDRSQCHEYRIERRENFFYCLGCGLYGVVMNDSMENKYVEISRNHECPSRSYDPERFYKFKNFILAPNFKIQTEMINGKENKILIIFVENDKSKCYIYGFRAAQKSFSCRNCIKQGLTVSAKLHQNSEGEDYIVLSNVKHICESVKYIPQKEDIILRPPDFKFMGETGNGVAKLFIFDSKNKNLCYIFSHHVDVRSYTRYRCLGCQNIVRNKKLGDNSNVYLSLCKDEDGEYFVRMKNHKHLCQPKKYEPEMFEKKEPTTQYFYFRNKSFSKSINVAILHPTDSSLCYPFWYNTSLYIFQCSNCIKLKKWYGILSPKMNENQKEYFNHDHEKHICKPIKISSIQTSKYCVLQRNELTFKEKPTKKEMKIDESRIIKFPNFEFHPNKSGAPEGKLVIRNDKSLCYEYYYLTNKKLFICSKCKMKKRYVTARVHFTEESNEKFLELSENEHICQSIKKEVVHRMIDASNFMVINRNDETKPTKIILFTSETKEFYFELIYSAHERSFQCYACLKLKKNVGVKLLTKENGDEYLLTMKNEHVCEPKKYDPKIIEPKTVPESMFEFHQNAKGEENKRLIVFASEKKDLVYEYYWDGKSYCCSKCRRQNKSVTAKLIEKENEKYLELSKAEHICEPKRYDPKKYEPPKTVPESMFELYKNTNGEENKRLILFTSEKKDLVYEYYWYQKSYRCMPCSQKKSVTAKLIEKENGKYLELSRLEHICDPKKYDRKKYRK